MLGPAAALDQSDCSIGLDCRLRSAVFTDQHIIGSLTEEDRVRVRLTWLTWQLGGNDVIMLPRKNRVTFSWGKNSVLIRLFYNSTTMSMFSISMTSNSAQVYP